MKKPPHTEHKHGKNGIKIPLDSPYLRNKKGCLGLILLLLSVPLVVVLLLALVLSF